MRVVYTWAATLANNFQKIIGPQKKFFLAYFSENYGPNELPTYILLMSIEHFFQNVMKFLKTHLLFCS